MKKIKVKDIQLEILSEKSSKGHLMYQDKAFTFEDLLHWCWRNCQGCVYIKAYPNEKIEVMFDGRAEIYTMENSEVLDMTEICKNNFKTA